MSHVTVRFAVKSTVNATLLNVLSTDSNNFDVSLLAIELLAANYTAMITIASILLWL
jgi:hypothetical protein